MHLQENQAGSESKHRADTGRLGTMSTSSWSNSNSPKSSDQKFKSNISFPSLRCGLNRRKCNRSTVQFSVNESVEVVTEEREEEQLGPKLRHPKLINDRLEFNNRPLWSKHNTKIPRGRSLGALNKVDEEKQQVEVRIKNKNNLRMTSFIDRDQFNVGARPNLGSNIDQIYTATHILPQHINSIAQIQESKQGLSTSINVRPSWKQIVDEADPPERQREEQRQEPIEAIEEQRNDDESNEQTLLRPSMQKLQGQQEIMKKISKSEELQSNADTEPIKSMVSESIMQENENENENQTDA